MAKGFVLSLDAAFAVIILIVFLMAFSFLSSQAYNDSYPTLVLKKQSGDLLTILEKSGELALANGTQINNTVNATLPTSIAWNMTIEYYNYSSGFVLDNTISIARPDSVTEDIVANEMKFVTFQNNSIRYYGIARLTIWAK
jgi:uncharacterized membrane protein